ncbi:MAG: CHAD domain-containing protein [Gammaproteobacteria bacterium]|nr:CHAD domain-containing protein [Gammaproteobacteria bacterium]
MHYFIAGSAPLARGRLLCGALTGATPATERAKITRFDSFDGLLETAGRVLTIERHGRRHIANLRRAGGERLDWTGELQRVPRFAADFPTAGLRTLLGRMLGPRALLPGVSFTFERERYGLTAPNGKLLAELLLERYASPRLTRHHGGDLVLLRLRGLRGYEKERDTLAAHLAREPDVEPLVVDLAVFLAEAAGGAPHPYVAKPAVTLEPTRPAAAGAAEVLAANFAVMRANEWGIRAGVDVEFLHDFRVAMRRMRSVFMDFRNEFPPGEVAHFRTEFGWLNAVTGRPRDLDVMLDVMPAELAAAGIAAPIAGAIATRLADLRATAHAELLRELGGARYRRFVADWRRLLKRAAAASGGKPLAKRAAQAITKRHRRIVEHPWRNDGSCTLESLHELRKECKKLRYLVESFQSIYAPKTIRRAVATLKGLQSAMGEAFDLHVQRTLLGELAGAAPGDPECAMLADALTALDARLAGAEQRRLGTAAGALEDFRAASERRVYRELLRATSS